MVKSARRVATALALGLVASCQQLIGADEPLLRQGETCQDDAVCLSGFCADGVCCDVACDGLCQACTATGKGAGRDGDCGDIRSETDPEDECSPGACDGSGHCRRGDGHACADGAQCFSDHCVDGVCCDAACEGLCQACTAEKRGTGAGGECGPIAGGLDPDNECPGITNCAPGGACSLLQTGSACAMDGECATGHCVGGACQCVAQITVGTAHTCAREADGSVWCWGLNSAGQVGTGTLDTAQAQPFQVTALGKDVVEVKAGYTSTCARKADGSVWCWGADTFGQTGSGTPAAAQLQPVKVPLADEAEELSAGGIHTCARTTGGSVFCWGGNQVGQIGNAMPSSPVLSPEKVTLLGDDVAGIAAGATHTCARKTDGSVWCWGANQQGQVGDGTTQSPRPAPVLVPELASGVVEIGAGVAHTCARTAAATWCWGSNDEGQLGTGAPGVPQPSPVQVDLSGLDGEVTGLALGYQHTCAITSEGSAWCWGANGHGQLGDGTTQGSASPVKVTSPGVGYARVVTGQYHSCALTTDTLIQCWGFNALAQLGTAAMSEQEISPVEAVLSCP